MNQQHQVLDDFVTSELARKKLPGQKVWMKVNQTGDCFCPEIFTKMGTVSSVAQARVGLMYTDAATSQLPRSTLQDEGGRPLGSPQATLEDEVCQQNLKSLEHSEKTCLDSEDERKNTQGHLSCPYSPNHILAYYEVRLKLRLNCMSRVP